QVHIPAAEPDGIFTNKPLQPGVVVARPTVTPSASLAGKSTSTRMRAAVMRPSAADAGCGDGVVGAATSERIQNVVFGKYLDSPSTIRCAPGGATALRRQASERGLRGRSRHDHGHDSSDDGPAAPRLRRVPRLRRSAGRLLL